GSPQQETPAHPRGPGVPVHRRRLREDPRVVPPAHCRRTKQRPRTDEAVSPSDEEEVTVMFKNMWSKFAAKIVQPDPKPEPSILDILDSRGTVPLDDDGPVFIPSVHVM